MSEPLLIDSRPGVTRVTFNRPERGNALDLETAQSLLAAIRAAEEDPHTSVLTLTGSGRLFCGGGDVAAMASRDANARPAFLSELADAAHAVMRALAASRLVVLVAANGTAAGAGLGLVLNADLVVAAEPAKFVAAYAGIGLTPDSGVSRLLPHVLGHQRSMELLVGGRALSATEAKDWGLVNEVSTVERFEACVGQWEAKLLRVPGQVLADTKALTRLATEPGWDHARHLDREATLIAHSSTGAASQRLIDGFAARTTSGGDDGAAPA